MPSRTPTEEAAYALDNGKARSDLKPEVQAAYDRLAEQRVIGNANADQAVRIKTWWTSVMETITSAGGIGKALSLAEPGGFYEDLLWLLLDLDWARFPVGVRGDGRPLTSREMSRVEVVVTHSVFRDKLSRRARDVGLATSKRKPPSAGNRHRPLSEDAKPSQVPAPVYVANIAVKSGNGIEKRSLGKFTDLRDAMAACGKELERHLARPVNVKWREHRDSTGIVDALTAVTETGGRIYAFGISSNKPLSLAMAELIPRSRELGRPDLAERLAGVSNDHGLVTPGRSRV